MRKEVQKVGKVREVYLDNAATTRTCEAAVEKIAWMLREGYGNASSLHDKGIEAEREIEASRAIVAKALGCEPCEVYFTSGGTEANNLAVLGAAAALRRRGGRVVTTSIEHESVHRAIDELERWGFEVVRVAPNRWGQVSVEQVAGAVDERTVFVSMMLVNNEVGSVLPVQEVRKMLTLRGSRVLLHTDAVQAFGKLPIDVAALGVDLLTVSGHKVHAPKGVGVLFVRRGVKIIPLLRGGEQQHGLRPGTEPAEFIAGMGVAVSKFNVQDDLQRVKQLNAYCRGRLLKINGVTINSPDDASPYILNFSTNRVKAETMLHHLSASGVYVSSGSACARGKKSRVLREMGIDKKAIDSALRISFSRENTCSDVDALIDGVNAGLMRLVGI